MDHSYKHTNKSFMAHPKTNSQVFPKLTLKPITKSFLGLLLKPNKQEFSRLTLKLKPKCFDGQTLKPIP